CGSSPIRCGASPRATRSTIPRTGGPNGSAVAPESNPTAGVELDGAHPELARLFHRLNNQLGVILANAELLEARLAEDPARARASQVVSGALSAISTVQDLRRLVGLGG